MNRRAGFNLFPILMLAALLLGYGSQRPIQSTQTQKPASAGVDSAAGIGVDILSDTQGVDFAPYVRQMLKLLQKNWEAIMPEEAKMGQKGKVTVTLEILPDGTLAIGDPQIEKGSDVKVLDKAAMNAIHNSVPFESLPQQFHGPFLKLRILFLYNARPSAEEFKPVVGKD